MSREFIGVLPSFLERNRKYVDVLNSLPWYGSNPSRKAIPNEGLKIDKRRATWLLMEKNGLGAI